MDLRSKIILIYGPTASGKSKFALRLANKVDGEIVNADSMQVYKELKILSARPLKKEYKNIKHHLYGFKSVKNKFSTGDWLKLVIKKIRDLKDKKKIPIIVGGTGLYFKALTNGLVSIPNTPISLRKKIRLLHKKLGQKKFFSKLAKLDPLVKDNINPSDSQRAIRAYEVIIFTNKSIFRWFKNTKSMFEQKDFLQIYIDYPRGQLIDRINSRVDKMIKMGAILEVKKFNKLKVPKNNTANKAIGVSEIKIISIKKLSYKMLLKKYQ